VATQGLRQPGSSLKPFVYLTGFEDGYTPDTTLFDVPTEFSTDPSCPAIPDFTTTNTKCFHPQNFEGDFVGPVSVRDALAQSINVPAVEMLYLVGVKNAVSTAYNFGLTTLTDPSSYGLSLVLGGGAVRLIDLTEAYSALAEDGVSHAQTMVLQVQDANGNTLESYQDQTKTVADAQNVRLINDILSDPVARTPLMGASENLTVFPGYDVALKTGTSNDYRDAWSMGYTPDLVVGVWAGNNDNTAMVKNGSSILAAVPIWHAFMAQALASTTADTFVQPDPTNPDKPILAGNYLFNNQFHTILYYVDRTDPTGPGPMNPAADPQYNNWETDLQAWGAKNLPNYSSYNQAGSAGQTTFSPNTNGSPVVTITKPTAGTFVTSTLAISGTVADIQTINKIVVMWNGVPVQTFSGSFGTNYQLSWVFTPPSPEGQNTLEVDATDSSGATGKSTVIVYH
jgi:membrane peptidoglycan carboxypeptidase